MGWRRVAATTKRELGTIQPRNRVRQLLQRAKMGPGEAVEDFLQYCNRLLLEVKENSDLDKIVCLTEQVNPELRNKLLSKKVLTKAKYEATHRKRLQGSRPLQQETKEQPKWDLR